MKIKPLPPPFLLRHHFERGGKCSVKLNPHFSAPKSVMACRLHARCGVLTPPLDLADASWFFWGFFLFKYHLNLFTMRAITLISLPLTLPFSSSISPSFALLFPLSQRLFIQHSLAASLMSVLSCGPPFHTAAFTITSITRNYLAVFPLLALSAAFISALELYAFQLGAAARPQPQRRGGGRG